MQEKNSKENQFDLATAHFLDSFAQRISRRGVLARAGKFALGILGLSFVPNLPLDRVFRVEAQTSCSAQSLCGISGNLCLTGQAVCCNGNAAGSDGCPSCTNRGSFWERCCELGCEGAGKYVQYWDCCGTKSGWTSSQAAGCKGQRCDRHPIEQPLWCGGQAYRCTIAIITTNDCIP